MTQNNVQIVARLSDYRPMR